MNRRLRGTALVLSVAAWPAQQAAASEIVTTVTFNEVASGTWEVFAEITEGAELTDGLNSYFFRVGNLPQAEVDAVVFTQNASLDSTVLVPAGFPGFVTPATVGFDDAADVNFGGVQPGRVAFSNNQLSSQVDRRINGFGAEPVFIAEETIAINGGVTAPAFIPGVDEETAVFLGTLTTPAGLTETNFFDAAFNYFEPGVADLVSALDTPQSVVIDVNVIPEPASIALLAVGVGAVMLRRRSA